MAKGSVKLSILSTFDDKGEKAAERAMTRFTKEYGTAVQTQSGSILTLDSVSAALAQQSIEADQLAAKWSKTSATLTSAGSALTMGVTVPLVAVGAAAVNTAIDFESSMSQLAGALNVPISQTEELKQLAIDTGNSTIYSAQEAAEAMTELAKGGLTEADIEGGALAATMALAAAGGLDLADAGNTIVQSMGAFSMTADDSSAAANALAGAANASSADVTDLSQGLSQCAAQASNAGWDIEQTTAVLAAFADSGIKGSDAGTSLKTALQRLAAPTDEAAAAMEQYGINVRDSDGNMLGAADVAQVLQTQLGGLTSAQRDSALQTIFGSDATRAATVLMKEGATGIAEYVSATSDQTAAQRMADAQMGDSERSIENMKGALETAGIQIGESFAPTVASLATAVGNLAEGFSNLSPKQQDMIIKLAAIAAAAGPVVTVMGKIVGVGSNLMSGIGKITAKLAAYTATRSAATAAETSYVKVSDSVTAAQEVQATATKETTVAKAADTIATKVNTAATKAGATAVTSFTAVSTTAKLAVGGLATLGFVALTATIIGAVKSISDYNEHQELLASGTRSVRTVMAEASEAANAYGDAVESSGSKVTLSTSDAKTATDNLLQSRSDWLDSCAEEQTTLQTNSTLLDGYRNTIFQLQDQTGLTAEQQSQLSAAVAGVNQICGTSISVLDGQNGKLSMQRDTIMQVTTAYQQYAQAQAYQSLYTEALQKHAEAQQTYNKQVSNTNSYLDTMDASERSVAEQLLTMDQNQGNAWLSGSGLSEQYGAMADRLYAYKAAQDEANGVVSDSAEDVNYFSEMMSGAADQVNTTKDAELSYISANTAMTDALSSTGRSSDEFAQSLSNLGLSTNDLADVTDEQWANIITTYGTSEDAIVNGLKANGIDVAALASSNGGIASDSFTQGLSGGTQKAIQAANSITGQTLTQFEQSAIRYGLTGDEAITAYANALAAGDSYEAAAQQALDVQLGLSSADTDSVGSQSIRSWYTGMSSEQQNAVITAAGIEGITVAQLYDQAGAAGQAGSDSILGYANGIISQQTTANDSAYDVNATSAAALIGDGSGQGAWLGSTYAGGIGGQSGNANAQGSAVANSAASGLQSQNGNSYWWGNELGNNLGDGLFAAVDYVGSGADRIADRIWSVLHFTLPEYGPLADMDTWVPDMADMYVSGLEDMADRTHAAALDVANGVSNGLQVDAKYSASAGNMRARSATGTTATNVYNITASIDAKSLADVQTVEDMLDRINRSNANAQLRAARAS